MGCAKSVPEANSPKQISNQKNGNKSQVAQKALVKHNHASPSCEQNKDQRYNENQSNSDNESISSRKNIKKQNTQIQQQNDKQLNPPFPSQQINSSNVNLEEENNAKENEQLLQQKILENEIKFIQNLKNQDTQNEIILRSEKNLNQENVDSDENKENIYISSNNNEQFVPTQSTKAYGKQESEINENYCNILRQQSNNNNNNYSMNSAITISGSINMLNSNSRLQNSNIVTSGLDYEKKKRDLIRKISDEIDEIEEIDENNFQFGATNKDSKNLKSNILKPKNIEIQDDQNDDDNFFQKAQNLGIKSKVDVTNNNSKITNINNNGDDDDEF